jgi:hypothetical protein
MVLQRCARPQEARRRTPPWRGAPRTNRRAARYGDGAGARRRLVRRVAGFVWPVSWRTPPGDCREGVAPTRKSHAERARPTAPVRPRVACRCRCEPRQLELFDFDFSSSIVPLFSGGFALDALLDVDDDASLGGGGAAAELVLLSLLLIDEGGVAGALTGGGAVVVRSVVDVLVLSRWHADSAMPSAASSAKDRNLRFVVMLRSFWFLVGLWERSARLLWPGIHCPRTPEFAWIQSAVVVEVIAVEHGAESFKLLRVVARDVPFASEVELLERSVRKLAAAWRYRFHVGHCARRCQRLRSDVGGCGDAAGAESGQCGQQRKRFDRRYIHQ